MDLTGQRYGRLVIIGQSEPHTTPGGRKIYMWRCICDCGNETIASTSSLRNGYTKSCGCLQRERAHEASFVNIAGNKYGRLTAIEPIKRGKNIYWICRCDCGNQTEVLPQHLKRGLIRSCGCLRKDVSAGKSKKHGMSKTRVYKEWKGIKDRCLNQNNPNYKNYGGRGIKVCDEWLEERGFENFRDWSMQNGYADDLTIERKNVNGNYCPENCTWIPNKKQALNTRSNVFLTYKGEKLPMSEWARRCGIRYVTFQRRIKYYGWSIEKAIETPVKKSR